MDAAQLFARIMERHTGTPFVAQPVNRRSESVADRNPSEHNTEVPIVPFDVAGPLVEPSLNRTGSASVANRNPLTSHGANEFGMAESVV